MTLPAFGFAGAGSETSAAWPAGYATGDLGLLFISNPDTAIATPTGWTRAFRQVGIGGATTTNVLLDVFYRIATSTSESAVPISGSAAYNWGVILTYSGVNKMNPIHQIATHWSFSSPAITPGLTTHLDDCLVLNVLSYAADSAGPIASTITNDGNTLSSLTKRYDAGTITGNGGGIIVIDGGLAAKGQVGITRVTNTPTSTDAVATIALQAATQSLGRKSRLISTRH